MIYIFNCSLTHTRNIIIRRMHILFYINTRKIYEENIKKKNIKINIMDVGVYIYAVVKNRKKFTLRILF